MSKPTFESWLPGYRESAETVASALGDLFQQAMARWVFDSTEKTIDITKSRDFLKEQRSKFPNRILFFAYSSQFDEAVESEILASHESRAAFSDSLKPRDILSRKAELLETNFKQLIHEAHVQAGHYTVALSANESLREFPLVWEVPSEDEAKTGFSRDYMWHMNFVFLCEIAHAIIAYGGFSKAFFDELTYIRREPLISPRLLWLDQDGRLSFPDREEETIPLREIANVLDKIE